jgi:hypothetical protein
MSHDTRYEIILYWGEEDRVTAAPQTRWAAAWCASRWRPV